ncbi:tetratricopeptide repeat protein [Sulfurimonas sp. HSL-1716]|uniref:tetratricopeptide repeat protein n=1 Tax=Hydrocurvibacter sulfurireducens TaxID=3131937 RepID=UPI0031F810BB
MRILLLTIIFFSALYSKETAIDSFKTYKDEELKLMVQSFLYKGDTENAYKVALIGYKKYPRSIFWNKKIIDTAKWTNRPQEAVKYEMDLYKKTHNPKLRDEIIDYGLSMYQYQQIEDLVVQRAKTDPNEKNIKMMIFVENSLGTPEKAATILAQEYKKDKTKTVLLTQELQLYLDTGDLYSAQKIVNIIEKQKLYTVQNATLLSYYYYLKKDLKASYNALLLIKTTPDPANTRYYQLLSDLSWYMQDYKTATEASAFLIQSDKARLTDYVRVMQVYETVNPALGSKTAGDAYSKYKLSYLFYSFANSAIRLNEYEKLQAAIKKIDDSDDAIKNEANYWIIKADVYLHFNKRFLAQEALNKALVLGKNNLDVQLNVFWFYLDHEMNKELKEMIHNIEDKGDVESVFYIPFASAYYQFNEVDNADYYMKKVIDTHKSLTGTTDFKFLQAYIYQSQNNEGGYIKKLKEILKDMSMRASMHPEITSTNEFWVSYLNAAMPVIDADKFEKDLHFAKRYLTSKDYDEISYNWATRNNANEKSHRIYNKIANRELWMRFNDAVLFQNHTNIENIIDEDLNRQTQTDTTAAARDDGQISLAQSLNYDMLDKNGFNQDAYIQQIELSKQRGDQFDSEFSYYSRKPLLQKYVKLGNRTYIPGGWDLYTSAGYFNNSSLDTDTLDHLKADTIEGDAALRKRFDRSYIQVHGGYKAFLKSYPVYGISAHSRISTDLQANVMLEKNMNADDTAQLSAAGKKDMLSAGLTWSILDSTSLEMLYERNRFLSQDDVDIGYGDYARISLSKQYRNGYPDIGVSVYVDNGTYNETASSHGVIDEVQNGNLTVLPNDFYNIGAELRYGMQNSEIYTRVWRPYFSISSYYSSLNTSGNISMNVGYGGKVFHQDHMVIGASFSNTTYSSTDSTLQFFIRYQFMYMHP